MSHQSFSNLAVLFRSTMYVCDGRIATMPAPLSPSAIAKYPMTVAVEPDRCAMSVAPVPVETAAVAEDPLVNHSAQGRPHAERARRDHTRSINWVHCTAAL